MFCPKCGEDLGNSIVRFCPRCGFPMSIVARLLANGGALPELFELSGEQSIFTRKNGVLAGIFWFIVMLAFAVILGGAMDIEMLGEFFMATGIFGALVIIAFSLFFLRKGGTNRNSNDGNPYYAPQGFPVTMQNTNLLEPQEEIAAAQFEVGNGLWRAPSTGEFSKPGSVTERTTRLLSEEDDIKP